MLGLMADPKKRISLTHRFDPDLIEACGAFIKSQDVPPTETAVMEASLREFLAKRGFWPLKRKVKKTDEAEGRTHGS